MRLKAVDRILLGEDTAGAKDKGAEDEMRNRVSRAGQRREGKFSSVVDPSYARLTVVRSRRMLADCMCELISGVRVPKRHSYKSRQRFEVG